MATFDKLLEDKIDFRAELHFNCRKIVITSDRVSLLSALFLAITILDFCKNKEGFNMNNLLFLVRDYGQVF